MRSLGRGLKAILILVLVLLVLAFATAQIIKSVVNYEDVGEVLVLKADFRKGTEIDKSKLGDYFDIVKIPRTAIPPTVITDINSPSYKYLDRDGFKGEFVTESLVSEVYPFKKSYEVPQGYSLVSVKFDQGDSANAWNVFSEQEVTLVYTPSMQTVSGGNGPGVRYGSEQTIKATIFSIKDNQYYVQGELEYNPSKNLYITFLVKKSDAEFIAHIKDKGRLDIIQ